MSTKIISTSKTIVSTYYVKWEYYLSLAYFLNWEVCPNERRTLSIYTHEVSDFLPRWTNLLLLNHFPLCDYFNNVSHKWIFIKANEIEREREREREREISNVSHKCIFMKANQLGRLKERYFPICPSKPKNKLHEAFYNGVLQSFNHASSY